MLICYHLYPLRTIMAKFGLAAVLSSVLVADKVKSSVGNKTLDVSTRMVQISYVKFNNYKFR